MIKYISPFFSNLICYVLMCIFINKISYGKKNIKIKHIVFLVCFSIFNIWLETSSFFLPKIFIRCMFLYCINKIIINLDNTESMINAYLYFLMLIIYEFVLAVILNLFSSLEIYKYAVSTSYFKDCFSILISIFILISIRIPFLKNLFNKVKSICVKKEKYFKYFTLTIFFAIIILLLYILNSSNLENIIISISFILIFFVIIIVYLTSIYRNSKLNNFNTYLISLNDTYENIINDYKMFKHNMKHELTAISMCGNSKVKKLVSEYINEYDSDKEVKNNLYGLPIIIKGIIHQSILRTKKLNIIINADVNVYSNYFDHISESVYLNLCESFGIIIDNALEASTSDDQVYINLNELENEIEISCINRFKGSIDLDYFGYVCETSKEKHMGIGIIYLINKNRIKPEFKIANDKFIAKLIIKK